ncbi:MAG: hypothetical protein R3B74_05710 [Nitrospirales bacterium]|nr:hypothetical protein [Nitrospirales bacterium]
MFLRAQDIGFLLAIDWVALAITIAAGLFALRAEYARPLAAVKKLRDMRAEMGDAIVAEQINKNFGFLPNPLHKWAVGTMVCSFLIALMSVCGFAIANL